MGKTIYFIAGEASADNHGAALMRSLRKLDVDLEFAGRGGPQMKAIAGERFKNWTDDAAVVGLWEVVKKYGYFREQFRETLREIRDLKPDAVVLIDYPGFNLRLARAIHQQRLTRKLIYYISPQVWAWNRGRIKPMAKHLDLMLCIFPFEADLYNKSGLRTKFVGHPMIDRLRARKIDNRRAIDLIGLFPGSREREVRKIFPIMLRAAEDILKHEHDVRFEIAAASPVLAEQIQQMLLASGVRGSFDITTGDASSTMQHATVGIVASGSATLEAAFLGMPFVLVYKVAPATYLAGRMLVKVNHLGMPNVLAGREIVPEFIQHRAKPVAIAEAVLGLKRDPSKCARMLTDFASVSEKLGGGNASDQAARAILDELA